MKNNLLIDILIFLILIFIPLFLIFSTTYSWDINTKKEKIILGKIEAIYSDVNDKPIIKKIVNKEKLNALEFSDRIQNNDFIFIYQNINLVVYVGRESEEIIGVSTLK